LKVLKEVANMSLSGLKPKSLWEHFEKFLAIPHTSGNEAGMAEYLLSYAESKGFESEKDEAGNVVVRVPASAGKESAPTVVLQGHMDMVGEKNSDVEHDFLTDPIDAYIDGDWVTAKGTTLGADNGIGLAAALAAAESDEVTHGPIEILATVDEEVGLTGAGKIKAGFLKGSMMLNLDSEQLGEVTIGCAGGGDSTITLPLARTDSPVGTKPHRLKVFGLRGGHSGIDIHEQRGNAIKVLTRLLARITTNQPCHLVEIKGGNKRNAIPREAVAELMVLETAVEDVKGIIEEEIGGIAVELGGKEKDLGASLDPSDNGNSKVLDDETKSKLLYLLLALPHGVEAMNYDIAGLVETSNNLATVSTSDGEAVIGTSTRSSISTALQALRDRISSCARLAGASVVENEPYPGWMPNLDSNLLKIFKKVHKDVFGKEPETIAIHAGLECGIIGEKFPGMDMISFGPTMENPHSPDERVNVPTVESFWNLLSALLAELAG
jgi:dipeptidase D